MSSSKENHVNGYRHRFREWSHSSHIILAVPVAYAIHLIEESFGFPQWVRSHFSVEFSASHFRFNFSMFLAMSVFIAWMSHQYPRRIIIFFLLSWVFGLFFHNALFHMVGSVYFKSFSPGLISSIILYLPLTFLVFNFIRRQAILDRFWIAVAFIAGGIAHYAFIFTDLYG